MLTINSLLKAACFSILFSASNISAQEIEPLIPLDVLTHDVKPEFKDKLREFGQNIRTKDILICTKEEFRQNRCHSNESNLPKYLMLIPEGTIHPISYELGVITKRLPSKIEELFIERVQSIVTKTFEKSKEQLKQLHSKHKS